MVFRVFFDEDPSVEAFQYREWLPLCHYKDEFKPRHSVAQYLFSINCLATQKNTNGQIDLEIAVECQHP